MRQMLAWAWVLTMVLVIAGCDDDTGGGGGGTGGSSSGTGGSASGTGGSASGTGGSAGGTGGSASGTGGSSSGSLDGCSVFPADNPWNTDISGYDVHPSSDAFIDSIGRYTNLHPDFGTVWAGAPIGIPYVVVPGSQPPVPIDFVAYGDESDPGPYPVPPDAPIEGGPQSDGDRHVLVVDSGECVLYELYRAFPINGGERWEADSGAIWDLKINDTRPPEWTSADAAGLPILPGLARYDEVVEDGFVGHALRFTVSTSQAGFIPPASHYASSNTSPDVPPMGLRVRMKAGYDCSSMSAEVQVLCTALKTYGMIVADNGADWYVSGAPDPRWDDEALGDLKTIPGDAFEVVYTGDVQTY